MGRTACCSAIPPSKSVHSIKVESGEKLAALSANEYFSGLGAAALAGLAEHTSLREFERGETLFWEGDPCAGLHILRQGALKLYRISPQGRQYIVRMLQEGGTCNEVSVFDGGGNPVNAQALEPGQVWVVEPRAVRDLVAVDPQFAQRAIDRLSGNLRNLVRTVSELAFLQVPNRLARLLLSLTAEELSGEGGARLTQDQLAARLGTVREVVARSLRDLERSGAIRVENRRILVADARVLGEWAEGPER